MKRVIDLATESKKTIKLRTLRNIIQFLGIGLMSGAVVGSWIHINSSSNVDPNHLLFLIGLSIAVLLVSITLSVLLAYKIRADRLDDGLLRVLNASIITTRKLE